MIQGKFGEEDELFFEIELIAADGLELAVDALLDTGFSGWLAIDNQDLEGLDWVYVRKENMRLAQGEALLDIYLGKVRIDGQEFDIPVYVGVGVTEFLLGRQWLKTRRLVVDLPSGVLTLGDS
ncbi:MAG TPA: aspartyl protease [Cyanobacteria bacterium UBA11162]|nr:aspartyl protease [Cyanobacteria bacterium UBA12227]HAX86188.1 aspartyl protease [Cyanobacteria bacterium UBA11370]HBL12406.1 aspartyl protease [Cyanobacteria bacterium UBA11162]HBY80692.1 aspartyl protease [Cyanobacteria bacterium UBA11148]